MVRVLSGTYFSNEGKRNLGKERSGSRDIPLLCRDRCFLPVKREGKRSHQTQVSAFDINVGTFDQARCERKDGFLVVLGIEEILKEPYT